MIIRLCGRFAVEHDGESLKDKLPGGQGRLLLAYLALRGGSGATRDELIDALWEEDPPVDPDGALSTLLSRLRTALPSGAIEGRRELSLRMSDGDQLDVQEAEAAIRRAHMAAADTDWVPAEESARVVLKIAGSPLLPTYDARWLDEHRRRLEGITVEALEVSARAGVRRMDGDLVAAEAAAREVVERERYRESGYACLMEAQSRRGNVAEALRTYESLRMLLRDELGTVPGREVKALHEQLLKGDLPALPDDDVPDTANRASLGTLSRPRPLDVPESSPFVGRERELERLRRMWAAVRDGACATVLLSGEAGIGKTRLAAELAGSVAAEGALVLYGRCDEGLAVPYQPFVEALRPCAKALGQDRLTAELGRLAAEIGRLLPELDGLGEPMRADAETQRFALFEAVTALLRVATLDQPALLVLDDLHWATRPTLLLLRHVVRSEDPPNVLVFSTYRGAEIASNDALAQLLADLQRDQSAQRLGIEGLDDACVASLLAASAPASFDEPTVELAAVLRRQTGGNPFFIRELLAHLRESGAMAREGGRSIEDLRSEGLHVPDALRQVIRQRVALLSEPARQTLDVAAVAGPQFSLALVEQVQGDDAGGLDALDEALSAGVLVDAGSGHYSFVHALVRKTIYEQLSSARRMRLHRRLGEALERLPEAETHAEALAHHFAEAAADGQAEKAATYALAAGHGAAARLGYEEAVAHYERGLRAFSLAEHLDQGLRCELLLALGEVRWSAGELQRAREACMEAAEVAERIGDPERVARAALAFGGPPRFEVGAAVIEPVIALLERALAALGEDDSPLRARVLSHLAAASSFAPAERRKPALAGTAVMMARRVGDRETLADVLAASHWATRALDNLDERVETASELAGLAAELGDGRLEALGHYLLSADLLELGDIERVEHEQEALEALSLSLRQHYPSFLAVLGRARRAYLDGRLEECEGLAHEAMDLQHEGRDEYAAQVVGAQIGVLRREQGRLGEIVEGVEHLAERYPELPSWRCGLAYVYGELGDVESARRELDTLAHASFIDLPRDGLWLTSMSHLSEVAMFLEDQRRAAMLYELLLPYADRCAVTLAVHCQGSVSRSLGLLAATTGSFGEAARHFEEALVVNCRIRSPLWAAHTRHDYARTLLRRGSTGDAKKASQLLDESLAVAGGLGLCALEARAKALKARASATT